MRGTESFYRGGISSFSGGGFDYTGFKMTPKQLSKLGFPGSAVTPDQVKEIQGAARQGAKTFEVSLLSIGDSTIDSKTPKQNLEEIRAISKLTGIKPTVHGPLVDPAGFGPQGWSEEERGASERRILTTLEKAHTINPSGDIPVVFHSANGLPGRVYVPENEKEGTGFVLDKSYAINKETGQVVPITRTFHASPDIPEKLSENKGKGEVWEVKDRIEAQNRTAWINNQVEIVNDLKRVENVYGDAKEALQNYQGSWIIDKEGKLSIVKPDTGEVLSPPSDEKSFEALNRLQNAEIILRDAELKFKDAFEKAYKYGSEEKKKRLKELAEDYARKARSIEGYVKDNKGRVSGFKSLFLPIEKKRILEEETRKLFEITRDEPPKLFEEVEEFGLEKAAQTFGNAVAQAYKKYGQKMPVLAIENVWNGMGFSRAEDMEKLIEKTREVFVNNLKKEKGISEKKARQIANKKIGMTFDIGHLNIMKKAGFTNKQVVEESKKFAKNVKHMHITDNFGFSDIHLSPGQGNVPIKEIMEELDKAGRLDEITKIVESIGFVKGFGPQRAHARSLSAFGAMAYGGDPLSASYGSAGIVGDYFGGYGTVNPEGHHSLYGAGFSNLPVELGGQVAGKGERARFGGTPMA